MPRPSLKLLRSLCKPDVFHMEMSERLRDFADGGDENVDCSVAGELVLSRVLSVHVHEFNCHSAASQFAISN